MLERWRDIPGWEELYQASNQGRIRSLDRVLPDPRGGTRRLKGRILSLILNRKSGHLKVHLSRDNVKPSVWVHRLVAFTWLGLCPDGKEVCHGPNGASDNSVDNLSYGTHKQNSLDRRRDNTHCGKRVRRSDGVEFINAHIAAEETNCGFSHICAVCRDERKSTGGYGWEYIQ
jgi:hypothetical protein